MVDEEWLELRMVFQCPKHEMWAAPAKVMFGTADFTLASEATVSASPSLPTCDSSFCVLYSEIAFHISNQQHISLSGLEAER